MQSAPGSVATFAAAAEEFETAWNDPRNTRFELPPVDVNRVLRERYRTSRPFQMTRSMLWDMEVRKAWDPLRYIPYVVSEARSWGRHAPAPDTERFFRASQQAAWIGGGRGQVLEDVFIHQADRRVFFIGRAEFLDESGAPVLASDDQPLFHVEHGAGGSETAPLNLWRIVLLTAGHDARFLAPFEAMVAAGGLPGFVEVYIEQDCGVGLTRC